MRVSKEFSFVLGGILMLAVIGIIVTLLAPGCKANKPMLSEPVYDAHKKEQNYIDPSEVKLLVNIDSTTRLVPVKSENIAPVKDLIDKSQKVVSYEELLWLNTEWQKRYMRIADSARIRKIGKDSILSVVLDLRDSTRKNTALLNHYIKIASKTTQVSNQNTVYQKSIDMQTIIGFVIVIVFVVGSAILNVRANKKLLDKQQRLQL